MKLTTRERILLPAVLVVVLSALFINFVYLPLNREIQELETKTGEIGLKITEVQAKQADTFKLQGQAEELTDKLETDNPDILVKWDQPKLLVFIESIMTNLSDQKSIDFYDVVPADTLQVGDINLVMETNYENLQKILKKLEKADYFNTISNYSITEVVTYDTAGTKLTNNLAVNMNIRLYAKALQSDDPDEYDFMKGSFGKSDIFQ